MPVAILVSQNTRFNFPLLPIKAGADTGLAIVSLLGLLALIAVLFPVNILAESTGPLINANIKGVERSDPFDFSAQPPTNSKYAYIKHGEALWRTDGVKTKRLDFRNSRMGVPGELIALNESVAYFLFNESDNSGPVTLWRAVIGREHKAVRVLRLAPTDNDDRISIESLGTLDGELAFRVTGFKYNTPLSTKRVSVLVTTDQGRRLPNQPVFTAEYIDYSARPRVLVNNNRLFIIDSLHKLLMFEAGMSTPRLLTVRDDPFESPYPSSNRESGGNGSIYGFNQHVYFSTARFTRDSRKTCELWRNDGTEQGYASIDFVAGGFFGEYPCARIVAQVDDQVFYYRGLGTLEAPMELWTAKENAASKRQLLTGLATRPFNHKRRSRFDAANSKLWLIVRKNKQGSDDFSQALVSMNQDGTDLREHLETNGRNLAFGPVLSSGPILVAQNKNSLRTDYYSIDAATGGAQKFHSDKGRQPFMTALNDKLIFFAITPRKRGALYSYDSASGRSRLIHRFPKIR